MQDTVPEAAEPGLDIASAAAPGYFWAVAVVGFLWNCIGVFLYMMAKLDPQAMMAGAPPAMQDYVAHMPLWGHIGWSLGIWGSFAGSVLMLLRRRHAVTAFLVSLLGAVASYAAQALAGVLTPAEPIMILTIVAILWWFCRRAENRGQLR